MSEIEKKWYVLRAISGKEAKVKEYLEADIKNSDLGEYVSQVLIPTEKVYQVRNGKKIVKERSYLPGYVLVEAALVGEVAHHLRNTPNVIGFLGGSEKPVPLRQSEVNRILGTVDELQESGEDLSIPYVVGETVKVNYGPFSGFSGIIEEVNTEKKKLDFSELGQALKHPGVWLTTLCMFFVYTIYTSLAYTVSFLTAIGATAAIASVVGTIRTYGTSLFSSPIVGKIAQKKKPSIMIIVCGVITAVSLAVLAVAPKKAEFIIPAVVLIIILSFFLNGAYGVTSSMFTETKVPAAIFGSASGILSVIGFVPDMFVSPVAGKWLDTYDTAGAYTRIFGVLAVSALLAVLCAYLVKVYAKKLEANEK